MMKTIRATHEFPPFYDRESQILILGSFPSVKSRESKFYYGHPQNRFWPLLALLRETERPVSVDEKKRFLAQQHIALWDVLESCTISGSSDSSIRDPEPTDLGLIFRAADIRCIFTNGKTAHRLFCRFQRQIPPCDVCNLPSTSPANAAWSLEKLHKEWRVINDYLTK